MENIALPPADAGEERLEARIRLAMIEAARLDAKYIMLPGDLVGCTVEGRTKYSKIVRLNGDCLVLEDGTNEYEVPRASCYFPATFIRVSEVLAFGERVVDRLGRN